MGKNKTFSFFSKLLYIVNSILATALFLSYLLPYLSPKNAPIISIASLLAPFFIIVNILFFTYWLIRLRKYALLSGSVLLFGWIFTSPFFKISGKNNSSNNDVKVMSYNVRLFNLYEQIKKDSIEYKIVDFINQNKPDILAFQEYHHSEKRNLTYPYQYFVPKSKHKSIGLAIFSNYKILNQGSLNFKNSANNAIFIDVLKDDDTVRVYNLHLQSLKINPKKENFGEKNSERLIERLKKGFQKQVIQTEQFVKHEQQFKGKKIICGDFNNTTYSWVYKQIAKNKKDAFEEAGSGFGKSFNYFFPMRIDFILTDETTTINRFQTFKKKYSDHFPVMARVNWE